MKAVALAFLWPVAILAAAEPSLWQTAAQPVLAPGEYGSWDDYAIRGVSILRLEKKWMMLYEGIALSEDERTCGLGIAESEDGVTWKKLLDEPALAMASSELVSSPCLAKWNDGFRAVYVAEPLPPADSNPEDTNPRVEIASSEEGKVWQRIGKIGISFETPSLVYLRLCFYANSGLLHLWWIGVGDNKEPAICHSVSRDGLSWSKPNIQLTKEIDSREMLGARVYPSGDFYVLVYVVSDGPRVVTKISRDAHSWQAKGPPEFLYFNPGPIVMPEMVFTADGARLFYSETRFVDSNRGAKSPQRGAVLRSAFCPKSAYAH
jgi:hypothetical protein